MKVLDTFTTLEAELEARRRQYQYYRDALLTFGEGTDAATRVRWVTLGEIATYANTRIQSVGLDASSYVGVDNLLPDTRGKVRSNFVPTSGTVIGYQANDILIGNIRPYLKKIWLAHSTGGTNQDVLVIRIKDEAKATLKPRYLYYLLASDDFFTYDSQHAKGAKMPRGDKTMIMKYKIPIPPSKSKPASLRFSINSTHWSMTSRPVCLLRLRHAASSTRTTATGCSRSRRLYE